MKQISVIIPTYNRPELLGRAIKSVLNQSYQDFEILIIDDCSTLDVKSRVTSYNDERIRYYRNEKSLKATGSRNKGISLAKGDFIAFLDDDDEWYPNKLEKQFLKFQSEPELGLVYGVSYLHFNRFNFGYCTSPIKEGHLYKDLLMKNYVGVTGTVMIRAEILRSMDSPFDLSLPAREEYDLWIRISRNYKVGFVSEKCLISYYENNIERISTNVDNYVNANRLLDDKYADELNRTLSSKEKITRQSNNKFFLGAQAIKLEDAILARKYFLQSLRIEFNMPSLISFVFSFCGPFGLIRFRYLLSKIK